jgi:FG-GAP-like repeat
MRDELLTALPYLKPRYPRYADYAGQTVTDIFSPGELAGATFRQAHTFATTLVRNNGDGSFTLTPLPREAQLAPVYGIVAQDLDGDGKPDLLLAGNFDGVQPAIGRMSASYGLLLRGEGTGRFTPLGAARSGFLVRGQARDIQGVRTRRGDLYVVTRNNDRPLVFRSLRARTSLAAGPLGPDDDHSVGAAHAVQRRLGRLLQHLDRFDVVRTEALEGPAPGGWLGHVVDHIQGLVARHERADPVDANGDAAVARPSDDHAGKAGHQHFLDRPAGRAIDLVRRDD